MDNIEQFYNSQRFAKLRQDVMLDLTASIDEVNVFLTKYSKKSIIKALAAPESASSVKTLREVSRFFYFASLHYRRAVTMLATLMTNNYTLRETSDVRAANADLAFENFYLLAHECKKYNFKHINPWLATHTIVDGVFYGLIYETKDTFFIKPCLHEYCKIYSIEDGVRRFAFDLNYFNTKTRLALIDQYGVEFVNAYIAYKGDKERGIVGDKTKRWFVPRDQICLKFDEEFPYCLPPLAGVFKAIIDLDTYEEIKKDKAILDNYKLIHMRMSTDSDGVPTLPYEQAKKYYDMSSAVVPEGIGITMSPFAIDAITLKDSSDNDKDYTKEATRDLFNNLGISPILFGITDNATSQTLELSIRTDESMMLKLLRQIEKFFNIKIRKLKNSAKENIGLRICFLDQSVFNRDKVADRLQKAATYALPAKLMYAAAIDLEPIDIIGSSFLENSVLKCGDEIFNRPLISSNTLSNGEVGRPETDNPTDSTEQNSTTNDYK